MGQSNSAEAGRAVEAQLVTRLQRLETESRLRRQREADRDYVYVEGGEQPPPYSGTWSSSKTLSIEKTEEWEKQVLADPKNRLAISALATNHPTSILTSHPTTIADSQTYNIKIPFEGAPITNQRSSGRCWLFASTNVFRVALMKKHNLKEFELSQAYLFYWDKLEKANFFLEQAIDTANEDLDGRLLQALMASPVGDGGQWDMVANLVNKYGLVPQDIYPDTYSAMNSSALGSLLTTKLREDCLNLRALATSKKSTSSSLSAKKAEFLQEIHLILTLMLGPPPSPSVEFQWQYYDADGKFRTMRKSPLDFSSELSDSSFVRSMSGTDVHTLFSLVNDPRNNYMTLLSVSRLGNVYGGRPISYVNVDMATIKKATIGMLKAGLPVFFGSDVGKFSNSASGIMDTDLYDYELGFNVKLGMTKAQRLMTGESAMTHAMVLTAVQVENGKSVRWRVQNSWGESAGEKGWFVMSDPWMDEFVYQVVVDPGFVSKEVRGVLNMEPKMLPLWDPMGALA